MHILYGAFMKAFKLFLLLVMITGGLYPLLVNLAANFLFPFQANGSVLQKDNQIIGSLLIAQDFQKNIYFHPRPSFCNFNTTPSFGSNYGPTSKQLVDATIERRNKFANSYVPSDLLFTSASGLDPHISIEAAFIQINRIALARSIDERYLKRLVLQEKVRGLGFSSSTYVNVLNLNLKLDKEFPLK
jgi:K+-transporting ATPase ATPase C chain